MTQLNKPVSVRTVIGGRELSIETGRFAKQADGSVYIKYGETSALVTVVSAKEQKPGVDFFPMTIEFQEKFYASGKIPGGFFKREAKPSDWATLNARMVDRPLRPLFPEGYRHETQIVVTLLSFDNENEVETIAGLGASAALMVSDVPFDCPIATVRVGRINGQYVINPTTSDLEKSDMSVLVSATSEALCMVEGGAQFVSEEDLLGGLYFGFDQIQALIKLQKELQAKAGKTKRAYTPPKQDEALLVEGKDWLWPHFEKAFAIKEKQARYNALNVAYEEFASAVTGKRPVEVDESTWAKHVDFVYEEVKKKYARQFTLKSGKRIDGRDYTQVRPIEVEVGVLPRVHGSALFTRGETQALVVVTLGTSDDEQLIDTVRGKWNKSFLLHYNFPPYSVGETGRFGGNSRREIGHAMLAERAVETIAPKKAEGFPYTLRVVSEIFESNGSSSMATVCGASMALMDAGVPIKEAVAGIAMGLMHEEGKFVVLSDILGDEDHLGEMDFKVCGTKRGITSVQMDIKLKGVTREIMQKAMLQAREGRLHILNEMEKGITTHRADISEFAPRYTTLKISTEKIKDLIGPGGKNIKNIVAVTGVKVEVQDDGTVNLASADPVAMEKALQMVRDLTAEPEVGKIYMGTVEKIAEYGAFVEIMPGTTGLCHISELDAQRVKQTSDVCREGDQIPVKVLEIDRSGKIRLSRKAALENTAQS
jgi:polyribonucleotide nucleotidyltransferase